jgi:hypothetical protein
VPATTSAPTTSVPSPTTAATPLLVITSGAPDGPVVWQSGEALGANPGPYFCCNPPDPGGTDDYSGSRGCSGGAGANGEQEGGYFEEGRLC